MICHKTDAIDGTTTPPDPRNKSRLRFLNFPLLLLIPCALTLCLCLSAFPLQAYSNGLPSPLSSPASESIRTGQPDLPICPHILLFTAARHGSTWMLDSAEGCKYSIHSSISGKSTYSSYANLNSELWNKPQNGPLRNISASGAVEYLQKNGSIKVFPVVEDKYGAGLRQIVESVKNRLPCIVLTRRLDHAHSSLMTARESKVWNALPGHGTLGEKRGADEEDPSYQIYSRNTRAFFERVRKILNESEVWMVDEFDYDDVKSKEYIEAPNSGCYIHNCNFRNNVERTKT